ncbi:MAG: PilZ domain-containing protein [Deltaproteobacteria bacterium]|nr:PilZ domain-containing protein [Deltaproteobacteria bacterium]
MPDTSPSDVTVAPAVPDSRTAARVRLTAEVDLHSESNFYGGFAFDVSTGGLFVTLFDQLPAVGTAVELSFSLPGGARVRCQAEVRWRREPDVSTDDLLPGVGLRFLGLTAGDAEAIGVFVAMREPIFYVP